MIPCISPDHSETKLGTNKERVSRNYINSQSLNIVLQNNEWVKEVKKEMVPKFLNKEVTGQINYKWSHLELRLSCIKESFEIISYFKWQREWGDVTKTCAQFNAHREDISCFFRCSFQLCNGYNHWVQAREGIWLASTVWAVRWNAHINPVSLP